MSGGGGKGGGSGDQTTGYRYYMGMHAGLCHGPVDNLVEIRGGDITIWAGAVGSSGQIYIDNANAYGGDTKEGGVSGYVDVMMGEPTQGVNGYLSSLIGGLMPAFRGILSLVFRQGYIGANNPYPKPWSFRVQRALQGWEGGNAWYPAKAQIPLVANGLQITLSNLLIGNLPNGTYVSIGSGIGAYVVGDYQIGEAQITIYSDTVGSIANGASIADEFGSIPSGTTLGIVSGPIINSMNPAHIVYEVLTNRDWGMGYPTSIIDSAAFTAAADQLYSEGFGLCLLWDRQDSIDNFLQKVVDHIGAVIVQSRTTGLFQLNLIRGGYDPATLPTFGPGNVIEMISYESPSITGATNEIVVTWFNPSTKSSQITTVQALGAVQSQGVIVSQGKDYPGISNSSLASRVAQRDLRATAVPLKRIKLKLDRNAFNLLPGGLFVLSFPSYGIASMAFRVGEVDYGALTDGAITVTAVQDVFLLPDTAFIHAPTTAWNQPDTIPRPASYYKGFEITYRDLARNLIPVIFNSLAPASGYAGMVAARPTPLSMSYKLDTRTGTAAFTTRGNQHFCPSGTIAGSLKPFDTYIVIGSGIDLDIVTPPCAAMIDDEIVNVTALNPNTGAATIARGCVDTVPVAHAPGARIWLYDGYAASDQQEYFTGESVDMKALTISSGGTLPADSSPTVSTSIIERQNLPYPPANFQINGKRWDTIRGLSGSALSLTWAERNRVTQMDQMIDNTAGTMTPEAGVTYTVTIADQNGTTIVTQTGITGTGWSWTGYGADLTHLQYQVTLAAVRAGLNSYQSQKLPLTQRYGWSLRWSNDWGGSGAISWGKNWSNNWSGG